jgi:hypothetical protein
MLGQLLGQLAIQPNAVDGTYYQNLVDKLKKSKYYPHVTSDQLYI